MGYVPPPLPFRPNLDRFGLPKDYETYLWMTYGPGRRITPARRAFLHPAQKVALPPADPMLMGYDYR